MDWKNKRAIAILRKSSKRQDGNSSFEIQEAEIRSYCQTYGLELVVVQTLVESAKNSDSRKKYEQVLSFAKAQGILHHVFYMQDREARNLTDIEANEKRVRSGEIVLHYAHDRKLLHQGSPISDFTFRDLNAAIAKQFSAMLSVKVKDSMNQKAREGW